MAKIFLSYNRRSEAAARILVEDIEALGHSVWCDRELSGGQAWWSQILATVRDCDVFVFVLDPESLDSTACKREYGYAAALGKPVLPVLVSGEVATHLLPPALSQIQYVDYREQDRGAAFRLARALAAVPPPGPLPDPLPAPPDVPLSYLGSLTEQVETAATLSYEQQSALVVDLKRSLRDPEATADARRLLARLRKRRDLFATIADEIDERLGSIGQTPPAPPRAAEAAPSSSRQPIEEEPPANPPESRPPEPRPQHSATRPAPAGSGHGPGTPGRMKGAVIGGVAAVLVYVIAAAMGVVSGGILLLAVLALGGAAAGAVMAARAGRPSEQRPQRSTQPALTGSHGPAARSRVKGAVIGLAAGVLIAAIFSQAENYGDYHDFGETTYFTSLALGGAAAGAIGGPGRRGIVAVLIGLGIAMLSCLFLPSYSFCTPFSLAVPPIVALVGAQSKKRVVQMNR